MRKIYFLVIIIFLVCSFNINSMVVHGQLDDGFILKEGESQHLFFIGLDAGLFEHIHSIFGDNAIGIPVGSMFSSYSYGDYIVYLYCNPIFLLPMVSLGYIGRWYVNDKFEVIFNTFMSSPDPGTVAFIKVVFPQYYMMINIWGPGVSLGVGFKKKIKEDDKYSLSYKLNLGVDYTGDLHGGISLKNSFLIGLKREDSILSLNPFINFCFKLGSSSFFGVYDYSTQSFNILSGGWIVLEPGFELVSKVVAKNNFTFVSTFMVGYEANFIFMFSFFTYGGKLILSSSFGIGKKAKSKEILKKEEN